MRVVFFREIRKNWDFTDSITRAAACMIRTLIAPMIEIPEINPDWQSSMNKSLSRIDQIADESAEWVENYQ